MEYQNQLSRQTSVSTEPGGRTKAVKLKDNRPAFVLQQKAMALTEKRPQIPVQRKVNKTGLPDQLKSGIENLSGHSLDDVKVHYNSAQPAQLSAHAYAQGTDIHLAPGKEKYLAHEAWHIIQQKQGRVKPTAQMKGNLNVNTEAGLEKEADIMGGKATTSFATATVKAAKKNGSDVRKIIQGAWWYLDLHSFLSQNPEPDDVTRDVAVSYIRRFYRNAHPILRFPFFPAHVNTANGWVRLPLRRERPQAADVKQTQAATATAATATAAQPQQQQQVASEEEPLGKLKAGLSVKEYRDKLGTLLTAMAAIYLPVYIAWETYKSRRGEHAGGGTGHVSKTLIQKLDILFDSCNSTLNSLKSAYKTPMQEGFGFGIHPAPMPVAEKYANFEALVRGFFQLSFFMLAKKEDIDALLKGGGGGHVASGSASAGGKAAAVPASEGDHASAASVSASAGGKVKEKGAGSASSSAGMLGGVLGGRNQFMKGYAAGSATNYAIFSVLKLFGFGHPIMNVQMPWDAFHVLNAYSIRAAQLRDQENRALLAVEMERLRQERIRLEMMLQVERLRAHLLQAQMRQNVRIPAFARPVQPAQPVQHPAPHVAIPQGPINVGQRNLEQAGKRLLIARLSSLLRKIPK